MIWNRELRTLPRLMWADKLMRLAMKGGNSINGMFFQDGFVFTENTTSHWITRNAIGMFFQDDSRLYFAGLREAATYDGIRLQLLQCCPRHVLCPPG